MLRLNIQAFSEILRFVIIIEETRSQQSKFKISTTDKEVSYNADEDKVITISEKEILILEENWVIIIYDIEKYSTLNLLKWLMTQGKLQGPKVSL